MNMALGLGARKRRPRPTRQIERTPMAMGRAKDAEQRLASRRRHGVRGLLRGDGFCEGVGEEDDEKLFDKVSEPVGLGV